MTETTAQPVDLTKVLARVRKLTALAEHPETPIHEAELARSQADALMLRYSIDQAMAEAAGPASARSRPIIIKVGVSSYSIEITPWISTMLGDLARHCRCQFRHYAEYSREDGEYLTKVYGFESDVRYFEILYTTIRLHMLGVFLPKIDETQTLDENCYRLHNAGRNWLEIADIYGWKKYTNGDHPTYWLKETGEVAPATKVGGIFKRAYLREVKKRGEQPVQISASSSEAYRRSAAQGYVYRLRQRLRQTEKSRDTSGGADIVLRTRYEDVLDFFRKDNPDLYAERVTVDIKPCEKCEKNPSGTCRDHPRGRAYKAPAHSEAGWAAGARHADTADISGGRNAPGGHHRALG